MLYILLKENMKEEYLKDEEVRILVSENWHSVNKKFYSVVGKLLFNKNYILYVKIDKNLIPNLILGKIRRAKGLFLSYFSSFNLTHFYIQGSDWLLYFLRFC